MSEYTFKIADQNWEFERIHRLNYETFVEEIPQHKKNPKGILVDKFHDENTYIICTSGKELVGMVAVRDKRPFSLDQKIDNLDEYLPRVSGGICEVRLLSIRKTSRYKKILKGLISEITGFCKGRNYSLAIISATTRQLRFYEKVGFIPFGPLVGTNGATFQPMYVTVDSYDNFIKESNIFKDNCSELILLPGPVEVRPEVKKEFEKKPVSHRSVEFLGDFSHTVNLLCSLVNSKNAELIMGSGTLANDTIAAQLSIGKEKGVVLSNGEFGDRLIDHATRFGLDFEVLSAEWGKGFFRKDLEEKVKLEDVRWLWMVHCETSTGVLNDLEFAKKLCRENEVRLCVDCISSIGNIPLDLEGVFMASGVSGKGIGSYPGLCFVFYNYEIEKSVNTLPRYLDLGFFSSSNGVPFTFSSNHLYALKRSLELIDVESKFEQRERIASNIRSALQRAGLQVLGDGEVCSPAVITFRLPDSINSEKLGADLERKGYLLSYRSEYLLKRNFMQIALMGEIFPERIGELLELITEIVNPG